MASLTYIASIARPRNRYYADPEINLYVAYHAVHDESTVHNRRPLQIRPNAVFTKLPRPLGKDRKITLANSRPI